MINVKKEFEKKEEKNNPLNINKYSNKIDNINIDKFQVKDYEFLTTLISRKLIEYLLPKNLSNIKFKKYYKLIEKIIRNNYSCEFGGYFLSHSINEIFSSVLDYAKNKKLFIKNKLIEKLEDFENYLKSKLILAIYNFKDYTYLKLQIFEDLLDKQNCIPENCKIKIKNCIFILKENRKKVIANNINLSKFKVPRRSTTQTKKKKIFNISKDYTNFNITSNFLIYF